MEKFEKILLHYAAKWMGWFGRDRENLTNLQQASVISFIFLALISFFFFQFIPLLPSLSVLNTMISFWHSTLFDAWIYSFPRFIHFHEIFYIKMHLQSLLLSLYITRCSCFKVLHFGKIVHFFNCWSFLLVFLFCLIFSLLYLIDSFLSVHVSIASFWIEIFPFNLKSFDDFMFPFWDIIRTIPYCWKIFLRISQQSCFSYPQFLLSLVVSLHFPTTMPISIYL